MKIGYELTIEQSQKLAMTPDLIQAIQILQFTNYDLIEYVKNELLENPLLESESNLDLEAVDIREKIISDSYYEGSFKHWEHDNEEENDYSFEQFVSENKTLHDFMMEQLSISSIDEEYKRIAKYIIEAIDDNGYLTSDSKEISEEFGVSESKIEEIIDLIQTFEPPGVCARSLSECLLIQLAAKGLLSDEMEYVVNNMLEEVAKNHIAQIGKQLNIKPEQVQEIIDVIKKLEPKPGQMFYSGDSTKYVIPDVIVEEVGGEYVISNNDASVPHLMVSSYYNKLSKDAQNDEQLKKYLSDRFNSAVWLIKSIEQRKHTIYNVAEAIVRYQKDFFSKGVRYLKPLTLKQIADEIGVHESTVSRSINGKYMQSPRGLYELKYFFASGVSLGEEGISSNSVKALIKSYIEKENSKKPLSDSAIVKMLEDENIEISRRTVAKYREGMGIASSSHRRRY